MSEPGPQWTRRLLWAVVIGVVLLNVLLFLLTARSAAPAGTP